MSKVFLRKLQGCGYLRLETFSAVGEIEVEIDPGELSTCGSTCNYWLDRADIPELIEVLQSALAEKEDET